MTLRYFCLIVLAGGTVYVCIELLWRGRSHWSMFLDSGLCAALIGMLNEWVPGLPLSAQALLGACVITGSELVFSSLFNRSYAVWDYRGLPFNLGGRINLLYCFFRHLCQCCQRVCSLRKAHLCNHCLPLFTVFGKGSYHHHCL